MVAQEYALIAVAQPPSASFHQLRALFSLTLACLLFSSMGIIDGLVFRRVRLRYGVVILTTVRGLLAQLIGGVCILTALFGLYLVVEYSTMLGRYCHGNFGCFVTTPITGMVAAWWLIFLNIAIFFCFIDWVRRRLGEVGVPTDRKRQGAVAESTDRLSYAPPSVLRYVNLKLSHARMPPMNRPEVEQIMEFVEQHAPFVVVSGAKQVMEGKQLNPEKLATVFLTDERFRKKGQRERVALEAVTEAYVATRQPQ